MSVYRLALDELIWLARACGVERLPDWRGALRSDGEICAQLRRKRLLMPGEGGRDCLDPVFAYLFSRMRRALAAAALTKPRSFPDRYAGSDARLSVTEAMALSI